MDFFEHQARAKSKTTVLVIYFLLAVAAIIFSVNAALWGAFFLMDPQMVGPFDAWLRGEQALWIAVATIAVVMLGSLMRMAQLSGGGRAVAKMVGARRILPETSDALEKRLINVVEEMSIASGTVPPRLYVLDDEQGINAFVAGTQPQETVLVVTRGALEQLNRNQLQGVIGHEYSHIAHGDMRINVRLLGLLAGIFLIGQCGSFILRNINKGSSRSNSGGKGTAALVVVGLVLMVVGYIGLFFGRLIKAAISRQREFLADAASVQYTRDNESIASALAKIGLSTQGALLTMPQAEEMSHMCFGQSVQFGFNSLLATHPPIDARIRALGFTPDVLIKRIKKNEEEDKKAEALPEPIDPTAYVAAMVAATTMASIGTITPQHIDKAHAIKSEIGEKINEAAHNRRHAPDLLIALLINASVDARAQSIALVETQLGAERKNSIVQWLDELVRLQPRHRLAVLNAMRGTLDFLTPAERSELMTVLSAIADIDKNVSLFEFVLVSLARKWLQPALPPRGVVRRFIDVSEDVSVVVGLMVVAAGGARDALQQQYDDVLKRLGVPVGALPDAFDAERLQHALESLNRLVPMLKKNILEELVSVALRDKRLNVDEGELLRAIAEQLNCPLPPLRTQ